MLESKPKNLLHCDRFLCQFLNDKICNAALQKVDFAKGGAF